MAQPQFFLKTAPLPGEASSQYTNLYLRHHGSGFNSVVVTPSPPKFIKGHMDGQRIIFTSHAHPGRQWGLTLSYSGAEDDQCAGWEKVEIVENGGGSGFQFATLPSTATDRGSDTKEETHEVLQHGETDSHENAWTGWMVCEWAHGHPQLFWVTGELKAELPPFCHRVQIVREML
ncbi:hypothetical protein BX600DRAFT_159826 [Xylariales sp. PMI_506]|nr:hypothetical protein BX600DRAFT_159826 [Xylariales sp. PMI_506]